MTELERITRGFEIIVVWRASLTVLNNGESGSTERRGYGRGWHALFFTDVCCLDRPIQRASSSEMLAHGRIARTHLERGVPARPVCRHTTRLALGPCRAFTSANRELLVGDAVALTSFTLYKQISAIALSPSFEGEPDRAFCE